jgi:hypothetical protein
VSICSQSHPQSAGTSHNTAESILTVGDAVKFLEMNAVTLNYKGDTFAAEAAGKNA